MWGGCRIFLHAFFVFGLDVLLKLLFTQKSCLFEAANTDWMTVWWPSSSSFHLDVHVSLSPECHKICSQVFVFVFFFNCMSENHNKKCFKRVLVGFFLPQAAVLIHFSADLSEQSVRLWTLRNPHTSTLDRQKATLETSTDSFCRKKKKPKRGLQRRRACFIMQQLLVQQMRPSRKTSISAAQQQGWGVWKYPRKISMRKGKSFTTKWTGSTGKQSEETEIGKETNL